MGKVDSGHCHGKQVTVDGGTDFRRLGIRCKINGWLAIPRIKVRSSDSVNSRNKQENARMLEVCTKKLCSTLPKISVMKVCAWDLIHQTSPRQDAALCAKVPNLCYCSHGRPEKQRSYNSPQDEVFDTEFSALQTRYRLVGQFQIDKECSRREPPIPLITWLVEALVEQGRVLERDCSVLYFRFRRLAKF